MIRFTRISTIYPEAFKSIENEINIKKNYDYDKLLKKVLSFGFGETDNLTKELTKKNYKCNEIIPNFYLLQNKWSDKYLKNKEYDDLIYEQIKFYKTNIIYFGSYTFLNKKLLNKLRELEHVKLILAFHCSPITSTVKDKLKLADLLITCTDGYKKELKKRINKKTYKIHHAFNSSRNLKYNNKKRYIDITFIGSLYLKSGLHINRINLIFNLLKNYQNNYIAVNFPLKNFFNFGNYLIKSGTILSLKKTIILIYKIFYIFFKSKKPVYGKKMLEILSKSKIMINSHIENTKYAGNMRLFEGTGMGCCVFSDNKIGLNKLFNISNEIVTYDNIQNLILNINKYLKNQSLISKISKNGQKRTLNDHNYGKRAKVLDKLIRQNL